MSSLIYSSSNFLVLQYLCYVSLIWNKTITLVFEIKGQFLIAFDYFVFLLSRNKEFISSYSNFLLPIKIEEEFVFKMEKENPLNPLQLTLLGFCFVFVLTGIVSNIAMILEFKQKDLKIRFNSLIILCAVFYLTTICTFILNVVAYYTQAPLAIFLFVDYIALYCSSFTMITISLERYLVLCKNK